MRYKFIEGSAPHFLTAPVVNWLPHKQDRDYQLWQEGSHPELIQGEVMIRQKIAYLHNHPVQREYVDLPVHWRYSSAHNYEGLEGLLPVTTVWLGCQVGRSASDLVPTPSMGTRRG